MLINILCFSIGAILSGIIVKLYSDKSNGEELVRVKTRLESYESLEKIIKNDFSDIARNVIKSEQEDLRKQHQETLDLKLAPLTKELGEFKSKVENFNISGEKNTAALIEKLTTLEKNTSEITKEANLLTTALTTNQNVKGAYGEDLLETILQYCGMQEGIHYTKQFVSKSLSNDETMHTVRPDVVINLPNNRHLIIDSKMTLTSYLEAIKDKDKDKINKFKTEIKKRITDLSSKNYQNTNNLFQPDFVLMYIPIENALQILYEDNDLINMAYKSNIILCGTTSLLTSIRLVNQLLAQQKQQENVNKIVEAGTNLYETFSKFCEELIDLKHKFDGVNQQFNTTINRFKRENKNSPSLFSQVETLKKYGITTTKEISHEFFRAEDESITL